MTDAQFISMRLREGTGEERPVRTGIAARWRVRDSRLVSRWFRKA